ELEIRRSTHGETRPKFRAPWPSWKPKSQAAQLLLTKRTRCAQMQGSLCARRRFSEAARKARRVEGHRWREPCLPRAGALKVSSSQTWPPARLRYSQRLRATATVYVCFSGQEKPATTSR